MYTYVYRINGCRNCEAELVHTHRAVLVAVAYKGQLVCVGSSYNFTEQTANCRVDAMSRQLPGGYGHASRNSLLR